MATVFTCVFVALLVLVNVVTTMLFDRYPITIDLTSNKIYSVSNDTEDYVKKVNVDVQVTIFADENTYTNYSSYNKQAVELLKLFAKGIKEPITEAMLSPQTQSRLSLLHL